MTVASYTPDGSGRGTLSVVQGIYIANIALLGDYPAAAFVLSSDGHHHGTLVHDPSLDPQGLVATAQV